MVVIVVAAQLAEHHRFQCHGNELDCDKQGGHAIVTHYAAFVDAAEAASYPHQILDNYVKSNECRRENPKAPYVKHDPVVLLPLIEWKTFKSN